MYLVYHFVLSISIVFTFGHRSRVRIVVLRGHHLIVYANYSSYSYIHTYISDALAKDSLHYERTRRIRNSAPRNRTYDQHPSFASRSHKNFEVVIFQVPICRKMIDWVRPEAAQEQPMVPPTLVPALIDDRSTKSCPIGHFNVHNLLVSQQIQTICNRRHASSCYGTSTCCTVECQVGLAAASLTDWTDWPFIGDLAQSSTQRNKFA